MSSDKTSEPDLSVVIVTPDRYETIRRTIQHLGAQTVRERLEIVIVAPSIVELCPDESELGGFLRVCLVEAGDIKSIAHAMATGIRQARAPVVAHIEDHAYPDPGWAEALIDAHRQPWAAVGPAIANANPGSMVSWANLYIAYGRWVQPVAAGVIDDVPKHNCSYKRTILLEYGSELGTMLERENDLHRDLRTKGYRFFLESAARVHHLNPSLMSSCIWLRFHAGRLFGARRARMGCWSPFRRLLYICGAPLIPLVHLRRILPQISRADKQHNLLPHILPALTIMLIASAVGETMGYASGAGDAMQQLSNFDSGLIQHIKERDRRVENVI